jgi:prepilin-type N-terminal cleavage/methylation domain-containing protein
MLRRSGFSLVELYVAIVILSLGLSRTALNFMNYSRQLGWLEESRRRYGYIDLVDPLHKKLIITEYLYGNINPKPIVEKLNVVNFANNSPNAQSAQAVVNIVTPP